MKERNILIDIVKGLGIIFVVMGIAGFVVSSPGYFLLYSLSGIYITFYIAYKVSNNILGGIFRYIGTISMEIMALHLISFKVISLIIIFVYSININNLGYRSLLYGTYWDYFYCIAGIIFPIVYVSKSDFKFKK